MQVGRRVVISSFKWFLPVFATRRGKWEAIGTLWPVGNVLTTNQPCDDIACLISLKINMNLAMELLWCKRRSPFRRYIGGGGECQYKMFLLYWRLLWMNDMALSVQYTVKKRLAVFPSPAVMALTKLSLVIKLFPASLVSEIPAWDSVPLTSACSTCQREKV